MKKQEKGITLIALIITIIVLLVLAVVAIGAVKDDGIITHAQNAASSYNKAQIEEEVGLYSMEYYMSNGRSMKEDTIDSMVEVCIQTGVSPEQLTVHYNKLDNSEYVLYRIDKTTEEERTTLEQNGLKALRGDIDLDGVLTGNDSRIIYEYEALAIEELTDIQLEIGDMDLDGATDGLDGSYIDEIITGIFSYSGGYIE